MTHSEYGAELVFFDDREHELIQAWLTSNGYRWLTNTVCGDCCGMYEDQYWVNGIMGKFPDAAKFIEYAKSNNISCKVDGNGICAIKED